jgi:hypothetical protein
VEAVLAAWAGDAARARRAIANAPKTDDDEATVRLAEAWIDRRDARWAAVIERLAPSSRVGFYDAESMVELLRQVSRWVVADAFLESGQPDSASAYLGLMLEPPGHSPQVAFTMGLIEPYVRARLVRVLAGSGRVDAARREWETLTGTVTRPDAEMVAVLDETRMALQSAGALQASRR